MTRYERTHILSMRGNSAVLEKKNGLQHGEAQAGELALWRGRFILLTFLLRYTHF